MIFISTHKKIIKKNFYQPTNSRFFYMLPETKETFSGPQMNIGPTYLGCVLATLTMTRSREPKPGHALKRLGPQWPHDPVTPVPRFENQVFSLGSWSWSMISK